MSWITVTAPGQGPLDGPGQARHQAASAPPDDILYRGSLYIEGQIDRGDPDEQTLFLLHGRADTASRTSLHLGADGSVVFARRFGRQHLQVTMDTGRRLTEGSLRVTVSWNLPTGWGLLTLECASDGLLVQREFTDPLPLLRSDFAHDAVTDREMIFGPALRCLALSDQLEPVGVTPTFATGTPIATPQGLRPIESLQAGDAVLAHDGTTHPIIWAGSREVPARGRFRPVRLLAPYFGLLQDVIVAPEQRLVIAGPEAEYLFSEEAVLVEAHCLIGTRFAAAERTGRTIRYHQILLNNHAALMVAGAPMESLYIGNLRDTPEILATTVLANMPARQLPLHRNLAFPALRDYEAVTLCTALLNR